MKNATYFISDLHLSTQRLDIVQAFAQFLHTAAQKAEKLYILGDLFEYWIGDDAAQKLGAQIVLQALQQTSKNVESYFIAGNRDFLVGDQFTEQTGFTILKDETVIDLYGTPTLILHGDSLCTDDTAHMQFRENMVTNIPWRKSFLALDIEQRIEQAKLAREFSQEHKTQASQEIMDVSEKSVIAAFEKHNITQMIHGHTHRQKTHQHQLSGNIQGTRYVLGDWDKTSSVLIADRNSGINIHNQPI